jgi:hypothetical protein
MVPGVMIWSGPAGAAAGGVILGIAAMYAGMMIAPKIYKKVSGYFKSDVWIELTETRTYKAPEGHVIYADPTY